MLPTVCRTCAQRFWTMEDCTAHTRQFHGIEGLAHRAVETRLWRNHVWKVVRVCAMVGAGLLALYLFG